VYSTPRETTIGVNGLDLTALEWGDQGASLALLLHGYPDTAWTWRRLGPHLAQQGWHAVAPFTRGYGPSDLAPDGDYRLGALTEDAIAVADALGADESAVLIGHDWGALTAWWAAAVAPRRFSRIVSLAAPPPAAILQTFRHRSQLKVAARQLRMSWYVFLNCLPGSFRTQERIVSYLWRTWSPGYHAETDLRHVVTALDSPQRRKAAVLYYRQNFAYGIRSLLTIKPVAPVLTVLGRDDGCGQAALLELNPGHMPTGSRLEVLESCGHFPQLEQPEIVHRFIDTWLSEASQ
jgi:pimeloyl-ACP methyl ester carboxylesterase